MKTRDAKEREGNESAIIAPHFEFKFQRFARSEVNTCKSVVSIENLLSRTAHHTASCCHHHVESASTTFRTQSWQPEDFRGQRSEVSEVREISEAGPLTSWLAGCAWRAPSLAAGERTCAGFCPFWACAPARRSRSVPGRSSAPREIPSSRSSWSPPWGSSWTGGAASWTATWRNENRNTRLSNEQYHDHFDNDELAKG